jgi:hypothetical protein
VARRFGAAGLATAAADAEQAEEGQRGEGAGRAVVGVAAAAVVVEGGGVVRIAVGVGEGVGVGVGSESEIVFDSVTESTSKLSMVGWGPLVSESESVLFEGRVSVIVPSVGSVRVGSVSIVSLTVVSVMVVSVMVVSVSVSVSVSSHVGPKQVGVVSSTPVQARLPAASMAQ